MGQMPNAGNTTIDLAYADAGEGDRNVSRHYDSFPFVVSVHVSWSVAGLRQNPQGLPNLVDVC